MLDQFRVLLYVVAEEFWLLPQLLLGLDLSLLAYVARGFLAKELCVAYNLELEMGVGAYEVEQTEEAHGLAHVKHHEGPNGMRDVALLRHDSAWECGIVGLLTCVLNGCTSRNVSAHGGMWYPP